jgi:hypothetical protein
MDTRRTFQYKYYTHTTSERTRSLVLTATFHDVREFIRLGHGLYEHDIELLQGIIRTNHACEPQIRHVMLPPQPIRS